MTAAPISRALLPAMVGLTLAALLSLPFRSRELVADLPINEDGYYALAVARHVARGEGVTIDGETPTNGFQPLFTFLLVPLYLVWPDDRLTPVRGVLIVHTLVQLLAALLLGLIASDARRDEPASRRLRFWVAAALYLGAHALFRYHHNGLETGFALLGYLAVWRWTQVSGLKRPRDFVVCGLLLGLSVLARIDAAIFVVLASVAAATVMPGTLAERATRFVAISVPAGLVSSPWWAYNYIGFGSLMPSSGTAQTEIMFHLDRVRIMAQALLINATPSFFLGRFEGTVSAVVRLAIIVAVAFLVVLAWRRGRSGEGAPVTRDTLRFPFVFAVFVALLAVYYAQTSLAFWFYERYLAPLGLLGLFAATLAAVEMARHLRVVAVLGVLAFAVQTVLGVGLTHRAGGHEGNIMLREQLALVEEHVPEDELVGAMGSGTLGYFRDRVVNLDGKVNPEAILRYDDQLAYLADLGAEWFCEMHFLTDDPEAAGWEVVDRAERFTLWRRRR